MVAKELMKLKILSLNIVLITERRKMKTTMIKSDIR